MWIRLSLNELLSLSRSCTKIKLSNNTVYTNAVIIVMWDIHSHRVNGNASFDGRVNETEG